MTPERWQQLQSLLNAALAIPAGDRARFLAGACAGDAELQHEAESLLVHASEGSGFLSVPGVTVERDFVQEISLVGKQLGPYSIKSRLGTGGMGDVYLAEDTRLRRQVAIKAVREPGPPSPASRSRLLREARAAGALNHPHIAAIYDIIEETGDANTPPHIVMEYVEGETLSDLLRHGRLETGEALRFARDVADALAAAHGRGIVHRDLKPANLRVTLQRRVKVLDFGLAQRMSAAVPTETSTLTADHVLHTLLPRIAGTPGYMSPEQVLGRPVGPPSDIFSLGIVLFEMLSGTRAFPGGDFSTAAEATLMKPVPRLADAVMGISPPIDALVSRMLDLDAAKRPTADQVLAELQALEPPTDAAGPARRLSARWSVVGAFVVVMAMVALVNGVVRWNASRNTVTDRPSIAVLPLANLSGDPAKDYLGIGIAETLTTSLTRVSQVSVVSHTSLADTRRNADVGTIARDVGATLVLQGSVQQSGGRLRVSAKLLRPDGSVLWAGDADAPEADLFSLETQLAASMIAGLPIRLTAAEQQNAVVPPTQNREALEAYWQGMAFLDRGDPATLSLAIASLERATTLDSRFAVAFAALGDGYHQLYTRSGETALIPKATAAIERGLAIDPARTQVRMSLASLYTDTGRPAEAAVELRKIISEHPDNDEAHRRLGLLLNNTGQPEEALRELQVAATLRPEYWRNQQSLGFFFYTQKRLKEAVAAFTRVIAIRQDANAYLQRGSALQALGDRAGARADYEKTIALDAGNPAAYSNLGILAFEQQRYEDAASAFSAAIKLRPKRAIYHRNLGDAYIKLGRKDQARTAYVEAIALTNEALRVNPADANALSQLAVYEAKVGRAAEARRHADDAVKRNATSPDVLFRRGVALALLGDRAGALSALTSAVNHGYNVEQIRTEDDLSSLAGVPEFRKLTLSKP